MFQMPFLSDIKGISDHFAAVLDHSKVPVSARGCVEPPGLVEDGTLRQPVRFDETGPLLDAAPGIGFRTCATVARQVKKVLESIRCPFCLVSRVS